MKLRCVFPVYNESALIKDVIKQWSDVASKIPDAEVQLYFYNDGSKDNSLEVLENLSKEYPITIITKENSGHGPTIIKAYADAVNDNSDWIFQADSDGDMEPMRLLDLWAKKDEYPFLIGYRSARKQNIIRFIITRVSRLLVAIFFGYEIKDVNAPFRLIRRDILKGFLLSLSRSNSNIFAPNLLMSAYINKKKIPCFQIPVNHKELKTQTIKQSLKMLAKAVGCVRDLFKFIKQV